MIDSLTGVGQIASTTVTAMTTIATFSTAKLLLYPILLAINLAFIHGAFGLVVLKREVIFIDLALAQCAVLGAILGHLAGIEHTGFLFLCSVCATLMGALLLTILESKNIQHLEAAIGILYVLTSAACVGIISKTAMESHLLKEMLSGHLIYSTQKEWVLSLGLYAVIGTLLAWAKPFSTTSRFKQFMFYALFGIVVSSSVKVAGILLVFSYLIIPMFIAKQLKKPTLSTLWIGWGIGIAGSIGGAIMSLILDIPVSIGIILTLGLCLALPLFRRVSNQS